MSVMLVIWMSAAIATLVVGNWRAYKSQLELWAHHTKRGELQMKRPTPVRFLFRQLVAGILSPKSSFLLIGSCLIMPPLMLIGVLLRPELFDLAQNAFEDEEQRRHAEWRQREGIPYRVCTPAQGREDILWKMRYLEERYGAGDLCEYIGLVLGKSASFAMLMLGLLLAPFGLFVPKASAQTGTEKRTELVIDPIENPKDMPFDPGINGVYGAIGTGLILLVPTDRENESTLQWQLRQLDLKVLPRISEEVSGTIVLAFTKFLNGGPGDPVLVASIDWKASNAFELSGGRILRPGGLSSQLPPHKLVELAYANTGITAPFIEHGAVATLRPSGGIEFKLGVLSGNGTSTDSDFKPDIVFLASVKPVDGLTLGLDFQTGEQEAGWRQVLGVHARYDAGIFFGQAEVVANFDAGNDRPTIGWYALGVLRPTPEWEPYLRIESLHDLRPDATQTDPIVHTGFNYKPTPGVALRAAATAPLVDVPILGFQFAVQAAF